jgi:hypothetical protein
VVSVWCLYGGVVMIALALPRVREGVLPAARLANPRRGERTSARLVTAIAAFVRAGRAMLVAGGVGLIGAPWVCFYLVLSGLTHITIKFG